MSLPIANNQGYSTLSRVLIVDDEPLARALEREILQAPDYAVSEAGNGEEALAALRAADFDVVLLDKRMPAMNGDEVCRRIRHEMGHSLLPIIMVTGDNSSDDLAMSLAAGATDFIKKPYSPLELVARVDAAVRYKRATDQLDNAESVLFALARMVEARDQETGDHCSRLAHNAVIFGQALGLPDDDLLALRRGGVLHDIGKLGIPDHILLKDGGLTEAEWATMRQHAAIGASLCSGLKSMRKTAPIIRHHHERWDGGGYPDCLAGEDIPLLARVFQLVDIFDALSHARPYKQALTRNEVTRIMREEAERGWRDPALTARFLELLRERPSEFDGIDLGDLGDLGTTVFREISALTSQVPAE